MYLHIGLCMVVKNDDLSRRTMLVNPLYTVTQKELLSLLSFGSDSSTVGIGYLNCFVYGLTGVHTHPPATIWFFFADTVKNLRSGLCDFLYSLVSRNRSRAVFTTLRRIVTEKRRYFQFSPDKDCGHCIRRLSLLYERQSKLSCPTETTR